MPRKSKEDKPFNQKEYNNKWGKKNMALVGARYKRQFVKEYKDALKKLGLKNSDIIRRAMQDVIDKAKR